MIRDCEERLREPVAICLLARLKGLSTLVSRSKEMRRKATH